MFCRQMGCLGGFIVALLGGLARAGSGFFVVPRCGAFPAFKAFLQFLTTKV
jgi:hypothetical protein